MGTHVHVYMYDSKSYKVIGDGLYACMLAMKFNEGFKIRRLTEHQPIRTSNVRYTEPEHPVVNSTHLSVHAAWQINI